MMLEDKLKESLLVIDIDGNFGYITKDGKFNVFASNEIEALAMSFHMHNRCHEAMKKTQAKAML